MAKEIFVPLLKKLDGMKGVKYTGGDTEQGIDVEYYELAAPDKKRKYTGIQFKKGPLKYVAGGNKVLSRILISQAGTGHGGNMLSRIAVRLRCLSAEDAVLPNIPAQQ